MPYNQCGNITINIKTKQRLLKYKEINVSWDSLINGLVDFYESNSDIQDEQQQ